MSDIENNYHVPVLYDETLKNLVWNPDGIYIDCTLGGGGHSEGILKSLSKKGRLISIDQDENAIEFSKKRLEKYTENWICVKDNFENIDVITYTLGYEKVDGILMDIGVSSTQLDDPERGFSYRYDTRLDMRMDKTSPISAYEVINDYSETELSRIIYEYGEERHARKIAKFIVDSRKEKKIETTFELVSIIRRCYSEKNKKHPAKKTFQAIRIEVNRELDVLTSSIEKCVNLLKEGGRLAIITFHSLEDRIVKNAFKDLARVCKCPPEILICSCDRNPKLKILTKKPIISNKSEVTKNNRAHSAKLRIAQKV